MKEFWNERYAETDYAYGTRPNMFLSEQLRTLQPGRLYLPGDGEGRNAVFAAREGWSVDAVDFSEAGRQKALALAAVHGVGITYTVADLADYVPPAEHYDAAAIIFLHLPAPLRGPVHASIAQSLKPGGTLIIEVFGKEQLEHHTGGPRNPDLLYDPDELRGDFPGMDVLHQFTGEVHIEEGLYHSGLSSVVRFVLRKR